MLCIMEAAAGIRCGGRTGLAAVVSGVLFGLSAFLAPVLAGFPPEATGCALVLIGMLMVAGASAIEWYDPIQSLPAFVTIAMIPFTGNVAYGIMAGLLICIITHVSAAIKKRFSDRKNSGRAEDELQEMDCELGNDCKLQNDSEFEENCPDKQSLDQKSTQERRIAATSVV